MENRLSRDRRLLILGTLLDPHVTRVVGELRRTPVKGCVVDYLAQTQVTYTFINGQKPKLVVDGLIIQPHDAIWNRLKLTRHGPFYFRDILDGESAIEQQRRHSVQEQQWYALYDVILSTHEGQVINNIAKFHRSLAKPAQQLIANHCGLRSPDLVVSNSKEHLLAFAEKHPALITKPISATQIPSAHGVGGEPLMTYPVTSSEIRESDAQAFRSAPIMLQQRVPKDHELRVVATQDDYRAYAINSQEHELTALDWRHGTRLLTFDRVQLPSPIIVGLQKFLRATYRDYGSFDLIVDPDGGFWFLECNPDGQWGWMENEENLEISEMLARCFSHR